MFPLAMIGMFELLLLVVAGWFVLRLVNRRRGAPGTACESRGGWSKLLGIAAVVAGLSIFWMRSHSDRTIEIDAPTQQDINVVLEGGPFDGFDDAGFPFGSQRNAWAPEFDQVTIEHNVLPKWLVVTLGSALVILGVLIFSRGRLKPLATSALTLLGIGAVLFAVMSFFTVSHTTTVSGIPDEFRSHEVRPLNQHTEWRFERHDQPARTSRAKRPALRPVRPLADSSKPRPADELPARAGEIPVSQELARADTGPKPTAAKPTEPKPAEAAEAQPEETSSAERKADEEKPDTDAADKDEADTDEAEDNNEDKDDDADESEADDKSDDNKSDADERDSNNREDSEQQDESRPTDVRTATVPAPPADGLPVGVTAAAEEEAVAVEVDPSRPVPDWVREKPEPDAGVYSVVVRSTRFSSIPECQHKLEENMKAAVDEYVADYLGDEQAAKLVDVPLAFIQRNLRKDGYTEESEAKALEGMNLGPMYETYALLQFDEGARNYFHRQWHNAEVTRRLWYVGGGAALVLALLSTFYGYLRLDMRTGGTQKARLQLAATLLALIVAAGLLAARQAIPF